MANPVYRSQYTAAQIESLITNGVPIIQNGTWWRWNPSTGAYVDTGLSAEGADSWHGLAADFDSTVSYSVGDLVMYDGELYVCVADHSGAWAAADFAQTTVDAQKASWAVALGAYPMETSSGATAETEVGADNIPLKALTADITAVWGGSGTPSPDNIRPITGYTGLTITHGEDTIPISWQSEAGTVYGGTLDVLTGVLTVTLWGHVFDGTENFAPYSAVTANWAFPSNRKGETSGSQASRIPYTSHYPTSASGTDPRVTMNNSGTSLLFGYCITNSDTSQFESYLTAQYANGTPVTVVWKLATPVSFQLTPNEVKSVLGQNSISSDIGDVSVTYLCDPNLYIAAQINDSISDAIGGSY